MIEYKRQQKWRFTKWHTRFLMNASAVVLVQMLAPQAASPRATESTLLTLTSASAAVLAQTLVLLALL